MSSTTIACRDTDLGIGAGPYHMKSTDSLSKGVWLKVGAASVRLKSANRNSSQQFASGQ